MECRAEYEMEYICQDCGAVFTAPEEIEETSWAWGRPEEYILSRCPRCGSADFDEAVKCEVCGELFHKEDTETSDSGEIFCEKCIGIIGRQAEKALGAAFKASELEALRIYIEKLYSCGEHLV